MLLTIKKINLRLLLALACSLLMFNITAQIRLPGHAIQPGQRAGGMPELLQQKERPRHRRHFNPEQFRREIEEHIMREAKLTPAEAKEFFPVFMEMKEKQRNIERKVGMAYRRASHATVTDDDCRRVLREVEKLKQKQLRVESSYMHRLEKIVSPAKLIRVIQADRSFGRKKFRQMMEAPRKKQK